MNTNGNKARSFSKSSLLLVPLAILGVVAFALLSGGRARGTGGVTCFGLPATPGTAGNDTITGTSGDDAIAGLGGDDTISGMEEVDHLCGDDGSDTLNGNSENDFLDGGLGGDTLNGGSGSDTCIVDSEDYTTATPSSCETKITATASPTPTTAPGTHDGVYDMQVQILGNTLAHCISAVDQQQGSDQTKGRFFCYIDSTNPFIPVNHGGPEQGDATPGPPPPPPYAVVPIPPHTYEGTGKVQPGNTIIWGDGCLPMRDRDWGPYVYLRAIGDTVSGQGEADVWLYRANCNPPAPANPETGAQCENATSDDGDNFVNDGCPRVGSISETLSQCFQNSVNDDDLDDNVVNDGCPPRGSYELNVLYGVPAETSPRQTKDRDYDGDGCLDRYELGPTADLGGMRDPYNPWDYFDPTHDGLSRVDDILRVVNQYFIDKWLDPPYNTILNPAYTENTDRTYLGKNAWNLGPPNGFQRVDDIRAAVGQYFHDCPAAPLTPTPPGKPTATPTVTPTPTP